MLPTTLYLLQAPSVQQRATSNYVAYPLTIDSTADSDGDGILNIYDNFGGFGSTNSLFITGINFPYLEANDALDSIPDYLDLDSDGDGINDQIEAGVITVPPSYSDPDGSVNDPIGSSDGLENSDSDPTDIDFRSL